jgi:hypothetical protein
MKRRVKRNLAVSTVLANLLMITLTISLAAILVAWAGTSFGSFSSGAQLFFAQRGQALQERFVIENVFFKCTSVCSTGSTLTIMIFVRNVGVESISLVAIYVNDTSLQPTGSGAGLCTGLPYTIGVGQVCEFNVTWTSGYSIGSLFNLIVTSARGNRATSTMQGP